MIRINTKHILAKIPIGIFIIKSFNIYKTICLICHNLKYAKIVKKVIITLCNILKIVIANVL